MKKTVTTFAKAKASGEKLTMLTAYDYSTAKLMDEAGVDSILVGDSLGNVVLGYEDTVSVTMEDMIHHGAAVARGAKEALVVIDMPFMSYQTSVYDAVVNAGRLMKEGRANAVKLEGGVEVAPQILPRKIPLYRMKFVIIFGSVSGASIPAFLPASMHFKSHAILLPTVRMI